MSLFPVYRPDHVTSLQTRRCFLKFGAMLGSALALGGMPVLPRVTEAGAPISIRASYITEAGRPGVQEA